MSEKYKNNRKKESRLQKIYGSQNFLTSRRLLERIVRKSTITKNDIVIEIGTGKGHLAEVLCRKADYVCSIEIDKKLYEHAKERLKNVNNLKIIFGDFMKYKLPDKENYKVFSNIPYYLTTEIVRKLTENANPPSEMWLSLIHI